MIHRPATLLALVCALAPLAAAADGTVTGKVLFEGKRPEPKLLPGTPEQTKGCCPEGKNVNLVDPRLLVGEQGGIANVVVTIEVPGAKAEPPKEPLVVDQRACVFEPHVVVLHAGATVRFLNSDAVSHNVRANSMKNEAFNRTLAPGGKEDVVLDKPDKVMIGCDYHPWMSMVIFVTDTPFHAVTAADGTFSIPGLKPGTYKAKLWHETLGRAEADVVVKDDGSCAPLEVRMAERKKKT
jgi:plastocyanin